MEFLELCRIFDEIEHESGRLKKISFLEGLLRNADVDEISQVISLSLGRFGPDYDLLVLGIKDKFLIDAISKLNGVEKKQIKEMYEEMGDIGRVAEKTMSSFGQQTTVDDFFGETTSSPPTPVTVNEVYQNIEKIASVAWQKSNNAKIDIIREVEKKLQPIEKRYYYRALVGKMRLGLKQSSWLAALASFLGDSDLKERIELAYYLTSDISLVATMCIKQGSAGIEGLISVRPGTPIHPMLAQRVSSAEEAFDRIVAPAYVETKYDGYRILIHRDSEGKVSLWSRNLESYTSVFPEIVEAFEKNFSCPLVLDGEVVAFDYKTGTPLNFQELTKRSRKYNIEEKMKEVTVKVYLFDIIHYDGKDFLSTPYLERRKYMEDVISHGEIYEVSEAVACHRVEDIDDLLLRAKESNLEGIMIKDSSEQAFYEPGKRSFFWLKYKADYVDALGDSFDLVIVGGYHGTGKRAGVVGAFLMAAYDPETNEFYSFCKVGSGFSEEDLEMLSKRIERVNQKPSNYHISEEPDFWVSPSIILEISAAEISRSPRHSVPSPDNGNLALRFPRYTGRLRDDKTAPDGVTTIHEIMEISRRMKIGDNTSSREKKKS